MGDKPKFSRDVVELVMRQTDYDEEKAMAKLEEHNGEVVSLIREHMGGSKYTKPSPKTTNQTVFSEIRGMMDDAASRYRAEKGSD